MPCSLVLLHLPNELLAHVLRQCPDLSTLWSLIHASARLSAIFDAGAGDIVNAVLRASVPPPTRDLIQAIVALRTHHFEFQSYHQMLSHPLAVCQHLDPAVPAPMLRQLVGLAHRVHALAHLCLARCLHRCEAALRLPPSSSSPPSWTEEQRALLAFWRVQFFYELKVAARDGGGLDWSPHDRARLHKANPSTVGFRDLLLSEQAWTAIELIHDLTGQHPHDMMVDIAREWTNPPHRFRLPLPPPPDPEDWRCTPAHHRPPVVHLESRPEYEWEDLNQPPVGWEFFRTFRANPRAAPLATIHFYPYRKFGFLFWEASRMEDWGLWTSDPDADLAVCYRRWRDILTDDEIARNSGWRYPTTTRHG
ncbi:hypothetical protein BO70DRAFT_432418 [Aspergillus heteromorphus CBS 117.55]|uniref:F-box domain-containing protein n=1 Tax=Aspergillus heteromorphus CBS 117.55 TaxID=1448321 RepID=A0A317VA63_9EURO|nr:uncharacterized protein BO70DRAFT_432418 [Aspergillus heteromorphus CBS 117.55]PWY69772.1 hypothetical protein BO70DRAFT_432418 [Aspergillus heteromorphus CBS 117.55]